MTGVMYDVELTTAEQPTKFMHRDLSIDQLRDTEGRQAGQLLLQLCESFNHCPCLFPGTGQLLGAPLIVMLIPLQVKLWIANDQYLDRPRLAAQHSSSQRHFHEHLSTQGKTLTQQALAVVQ